jgi:hypothetical protein
VIAKPEIVSEFANFVVVVSAHSQDLVDQFVLHDVYIREGNCGVKGLLATYKNSVSIWMVKKLVAKESFYSRLVSSIRNGDFLAHNPHSQVCGRLAGSEKMVTLAIYWPERQALSPTSTKPEVSGS